MTALKDILPPVKTTRYIVFLLSFLKHISSIAKNIKQVQPKSTSIIFLKLRI